MRITLDGTPLLTPKTGVGRYTNELIPALKCLPEAPKIHISYGLQWSRFVRQREIDAGDITYQGVVLKKRFRWIPDSVKNFLKEKFVQSELALFRPDVYHATNYAADSHHVPLVITIHDLSHLRYPETHPTERLEWLETHLPKSLNKASQFITVSEFTKKEAVNLLNVPEDRVNVVPNGVNESYQPRDGMVLSERLKALDLEPKRYILSVGTLEPRKNILSLLRAYERLPGTVQSRWPLVIVGMRGWKDRSIAKGIVALERKGIVRPLGYVSDDILPFVYAGAALFIYLSLYEGFGLPLVEAMASGVPVVASSGSSIPEVVGNA